ncbi:MULTISPECIES: helix-turn-helix transcriptional regulator [unclassified Streptomyces]|uniref:helix-turn-helix transcriptional regulator n=1 Tax=unclassified Streptomyces TaxID=2593676 RepID=UPI004040FDEA
MHRLQPAANGLRTDHPVPGLPFVDDTHLPVDDPAAIEAVGRHEEGGTWGRWDKDRTTDGAWLAFTTDPIRQDLAWVVRYHPEHGRTVLLVPDKEASSWHSSWWGPQLLFRQGGYWWDGTTWFRPDQVWDPASERYDHRPVKAAITITADDLLDDNAHPAGGRLLKVANFDLDAPPPDQWNDHLALWASQRSSGALPLERCVVRLSAPELAADQLIGLPELAELGGIAASTLRAYVSRGEGNVPPPQTILNGRNLWARPVAMDWAEQRHRSADSAAATLSSDTEDDLPLGASELRQRLARLFFGVLWERPDRRKRWALRHRTEAAVHEVANELAWSVAADTESIIDPYDLATTILHAFLDELSYGKDLDASLGDTSSTFYGITTSVAKMLDWLIGHHPQAAHHIIGEIIGDAERRLEIPREVTAQSIRTALGLDGKLPRQARLDFLDRALPPASHT